MSARGMQAAGSWGPEECCENSGNWCGSAFWPAANRTACVDRTVPYWDCGCIDRTSASDFLFRLEGPDGPARKFPDGARVFRTGSACWNCDDIPGPNSKAGYQNGYGSISGPPYPAGYHTDWPAWGNDDLILGDAGGPPGEFGYCLQGGTYAGYESNACGGDSNWGHTDLQVVTLWARNR